MADNQGGDVSPQGDDFGVIQIEVAMGVLSG